MAFVLLFTFSSCGAQMSNKQLQKLLEDDRDFSHIDFSSVKVLAEKEIDSDTSALMFSAKEKDEDGTFCYISIFNKKSDDLFYIESPYAPLNYLMNEISKNRPQGLNNSLFEKLTGKIAKEDTEFFDDEENSAEFLRELTGKGGIISQETAQEIITDAARKDLNFEDDENFCAVFEKGCALPLCYATKSNEAVFSWDWIAEEQYLSFVSASTKDELKEAEEKYGPAYDEKEVWVAYDLTGEKQEIYETKTELFEKVTGSKADFEEEKMTEGILKFATVSNNKPFAYVSNGSLVGFDIEIAQAIAKELNMELEISSMASSMAVKNTGNGTFNMAMGGFTTAQSGENISFTDNYYGDHVIILSKTASNINQKICSALSKISKDGTIDVLAQKYKVSKESAKVEEKVEEKADENQVQAETPTDTTIKYRVRKSADDSKTQLSAFASLENAKKDANAHKDEGYKVYDMSGKLVYTP